jgi:hypothetical protein
MLKGKFYKIYIAGSIILASMSSCEKYLTQAPVDTVPEEKIFESVAGVQSALNGVYSGASGVYEANIYASALVSDEATLPAENNTGRGVITYRWQYDAAGGDQSASFNAAYVTLNRINKILDNIDKVPTKDADEEGAKARIKGETIALRAYCHLELLRAFPPTYDGGALGIVYMKTSENGKPARTTVADNIASLKADLVAAKALIPTTNTDPKFITKAAIAAMQANVAAYEKNWDEAITYSTEAIAAVPLASQAQYINIWKDAANNEVLLKFTRVVGEARIGDTYYDRTQSKIVYAPSKELIDTYNTATDVRYGTTVFLYAPTRPGLAKYRGGNAAAPNLADLKAYRTAEMYLIRAEANAEKNQLGPAATDINTLRRARITGYVDVTFASKDAAITAIVLERLKELAFEGKRYFDLKRRGLPITRLPEDAGNAQGAVNLTPDKREYVFPIPNREILANENMQQNPGY